jgi:ankyrin repeat protein
VKLDNEELVKLLLDKEVDFKLVNKMGCNVFHMCARNKTANIMRQLASKFSGK